MENIATKQFVYIKEQIDNIPPFSVGMIEKNLQDFYEVQFVYAASNKTLDKHKCTIFDPLKTGDSFTHKICNICHRYLPIQEFSLNQNGKNNRPIRRPACNKCRKIIDGISISMKDKKEWQKKKPHLIIWECPICHKRTIPDVTSKVVLDHDHATGRVRGYICDSCNTGIGRFKDEISLLMSAINFLKTK